MYHEHMIFMRIVNEVMAFCMFYLLHKRFLADDDEINSMINI